MENCVGQLVVTGSGLPEVPELPEPLPLPYGDWDETMVARKATVIARNGIIMNTIF